MKTFLISSAVSLFGTSAMAHGGAHLHPHGADTFLMAVLVVGFGIAALLAVRR